jgi:hypothetical protein
MRISYLFCLIFLISSCSAVIPKHELVQLTNIDEKKAVFQIDQYNNDQVNDEFYIFFAYSFCHHEKTP